MTAVMPALTAWSWKVGIRGDGSGGERNSLNVATQEMRIRDSPVPALAFDNFKRSTVSLYYSKKVSTLSRTAGDLLLFQLKGPARGSTTKANLTYRLGPETMAPPFGLEDSLSPWKISISRCDS